MRQKRKALTLLELMLAMIIVAIVVAGLILTFGRMQVKAQEKVADAMLRTVLAAAKDYRSQYGVYPSNMNWLVPKYMEDPNAQTSASAGWTYTIVSGGADVFSATATGKIHDTAGKTKTIDKDGNVS